MGEWRGKPVECPKQVQRAAVFRPSVTYKWTKHPAPNGGPFWEAPALGAGCFGHHRIRPGDPVVRCGYHGRFSPGRPFKKDVCDHCMRCVEACPVKALSGNGKINKKLCGDRIFRIFPPGNPLVQSCVCIYQRRNGRHSSSHHRSLRERRRSSFILWLGAILDG
ncbi:MAG: hypothetical protein C4519_02730 [Desulfobacteraceae bacterium]|nr:MAG: hypothetical protein C4519_02730 [Desulfobacteraceae bacterium]